MKCDNSGICTKRITMWYEVKIGECGVNRSKIILGGDEDVLTALQQTETQLPILTIPSILYHVISAYIILRI